MSHHGATVLQGLLAGLIATALLFNGAADLSLRAPLTILFAVAAGLELFLPTKNVPVRPMIRRTLFVYRIGFVGWTPVSSLTSLVACSSRLA